MSCIPRAHDRLWVRSVWKGAGRTHDPAGRDAGPADEAEGLHGPARAGPAHEAALVVAGKLQGLDRLELQAAAALEL